MSQRRDFFKRLARLGAAFWAGGRAAVAQQHQHGQDHTLHPMQRNASGQAAGVEQGVARGKTRPPASTAAQSKPAFNLPVETPDLPKLPHKMVDGWKEFHLIAEVVETELVPGRKMHAWGFNGSVPGPTIEVNQGEKVRVV
ncbi:MAG: multicopper oxidase domain-containing protein, partial [Bryobacteraceae bacterium]